MDHRSLGDAASPFASPTDFFVQVFPIRNRIGDGEVEAAHQRDLWDNNSPLAKSLTPEQFAQLSRTALRGYDACSAGDERFATDFFKQLGAALAKPKDVFNSINSSPLAKKP